MTLFSKRLEANVPRVGVTVTLALTFFVSFVVLFLLMDREINLFDEGIILSGAMRVNAGEVVHRDFYTLYGPGNYYVVAALFRLFDIQFVAARVYGMLVMASIVTITTSLVLGRVRFFVAVLVAFSCLLTMSASSSYLYPLFPCLLLTLVSSRLLIRKNAADERMTLLVAGALIGLSAYFRYDLALLVLLSHLLALAVLDGSNAPARRWVGLAKAGTVYCLGALVVFLPGVIAFLRVASPSTFYADIVDYGLKYYGPMRGRPFPGPSLGLSLLSAGNAYIPLIAGVLFITETARSHAVSTDAFKEILSSRRLVVVFGILTLAMFTKGLVRVSTIHLIASIVPALIVIAICTDPWSRARPVLKVMAIGAVLVIAYPAVIATTKVWILYAADPARSVAGWLSVQAGPPSRVAGSALGCAEPRALFLVRQPSYYATVSTYLRAATAPTERILIGLDQHDRIFANSLALYFTTGRLPATHWHQYDPGMQTRADIQAAMVKELEENGTRWVVRDGSFGWVSEPNGSSRSSNVHVLDEYLDAHFREVAHASRIRIMLRNGVEPPAPAALGPRACLPAVAWHVAAP